jgi:hypothetical protein
MKNFALLFLIAVSLCCCKTNETQVASWETFQKCASNACIKEALAVKDDFLKNPLPLLTAFQATYAKGEDHVIGWLYVLRDSVLTNPNMGTLTARIGIQQALIKAAKPFENDPKVKEMAKSVIENMEMIAMMAETEGHAEGEADESNTVPITGTYGYDNGDNGNGEVEIAQIAADQFKFKINITGGPPSHNSGILEGVAKLSNNKGIFSMNEYGGECKVEFTFANGLVVKMLKGSDAICGFGMNVAPEGTFARKTYNDPFLTKKEAAVVANLVGEWQSSDDPKAGLKIANGTFQLTYTGQSAAPVADQAKGMAMPYIYFPACPKDCNPVAKMPCLKVIGQDEVCYAIVKADGKSLDISQIGGKGNTNKYVKKK